MTKSDSKPTTPKMDSDESTVIDLKGAEQHHDLKNKAGDANDSDHADKPVSQKAKDIVEDAVDGKSDTAVADALNKAVK